MNISIRKYYEEREAKYDQRRDEHDRKETELKNEISSLNGQKDSLSEEKGEICSRIEKNKEDGVDNKPLDEKQIKMEQEIESIEKKLSRLKKQFEQRPDILPNDSYRENELVEVLEKYFDCREAMEMKGIGDCIASLPVSVGHEDLDDTGRPTKCAIILSRYSTKPVSISPGEHFFKNFRPSTLDWLPKSEDKACSDGSGDKPSSTSEILAYIDRGEDRLILTKTDLSWTIEYKKDDYGHRRPSEDKEEDFSGVATSLEALLEEMIEAEDGEVDLDKSYPAASLMAHVQSKIVSRTTTEPLFRPCSEKLESGKVYELIKDHWNGIKKAPWSDDVEGKLALLKYLLENGERARFWSKPFENYYGFRLRSRDHDWLVGEIYVGADISTASDKTAIHPMKSDYSSAQIARIGDMVIHVWRS